MALTQFTDDWNASFELKITVGDIKKPTQSLLIEILEMFLARNHIDCNKLKAKMDERHYKIWMVKYFSDFFKALRAKYTFIYGDFMQPVSKKFFEILRLLHNYHLFMKEVRDEVLNAANNKIETYNQLLSKKTQLQLYQEEFKIRSEKKESALLECTHLITVNKRLLEELETKSISLTKDTDSATKELYRVRDENIKLSSEITELSTLVVPEHEVNLLTSAIKAADDEISQLNSIRENLESQNESFTHTIILVNAELGEFSIINNDNSVLDRVEKCRDEIKNLTEMKIKAKEFLSRIETTRAKRVELLESIKSMEGQLLKKRNDLNSILESSQIKTMAMESEYKRSLIHTTNYEKKLEMAGQHNEDLKLTQEHLITMGIEVVERIENS